MALSKPASPSRFSMRLMSSRKSSESWDLISRKGSVPVDSNQWRFSHFVLSYPICLRKSAVVVSSLAPWIWGSLDWATSVRARRTAPRRYVCPHPDGEEDAVL